MIHRLLSVGVILTYFYHLFTKFAPAFRAIPRACRRKSTMAGADPALAKHAELPDSSLSVQNIEEKQGINEYSRNMRSKMIKIKIGKNDGEPYFVHSKLLLKSSRYFHGCLKSGLKESRSSEVVLDLEEQDIVPLSHYIGFLYTGDYKCQDAIDPSNPPSIPENETQKDKLRDLCLQQAFLHARIFLLGEWLLSDELKRVSLGKLSYVLCIGLDYPPRKKRTNKRGDVLNKYVDRFPADGHGADSYRNSYASGEKVISGTAAFPRLPTLLPPAQLGKLVTLVYENTPKRRSPIDELTGEVSLENDSDIRIFLAVYCAITWETLSASEQFMDVVFNNREIFDDVMGYSTYMMTTTSCSIM